ncbi:MAG: peptidoglycan DD-metalloendopeptidase family protein [Burkholderiales bacterium]
MISVRHCLVSIGILLVLGAPAVEAARKKPQPSEELKALRGRIDELQKDIAKKETSKSEVADDLKESEKEISETNRTLSELALEQKETAGELAALQSKTGTLKTNVTKHQADLEKLIKNQYQSGGDDALKLLLNGKDPAQVSRHMHYYSYLAKARADSIQSLKSDIAQLNLAEAETRATAKQLADLKAEEARQKQKLLSERQKRKNLLDRISGQIKNQKREVGKLKQDEARISQLVDRLAKMLAQKKKKSTKSAAKATAPENVKPGAPAIQNDEEPDDSFRGTSFASLRGKLKLPVRGELANRYGSPREGGGLTWKGLFIRAAEGAGVKAVADGRVVFADWLRGFGNLMILDHGGGYMSLYGNNESLLKQVGTSIKPGDTIASVGNSGGNAESGLYFELRHQGKTLDPLPWTGR